MKDRIEEAQPTVPSQIGAGYLADVEAFLVTSSSEIIGSLSLRSAFQIDLTQRDAWESQIDILKAALKDQTGTLLLEFDVPRIGSRIDAVLLSGSAILVLEFKIGESAFHTEHVNQVWDYALDLKNFHSASHACQVFPILVASSATRSDTEFGKAASDDVFPPARANPSGLSGLIAVALAQSTGVGIDRLAWPIAPYRPTPTIIEAARALYSQHSVNDIARNDAGTQNLGITSRRVEELVELARIEQRKIIIFVTGVPGAGKTLVGLDVATKKREDNPTHAVFLSGNAPLVAVLREALTRDELTRRRRNGDSVRKGDVAQKVKAFIQNVHHFRDAALRDLSAPADHVVIFDEAQRAWNQRQTANFMLRRKKRPGFTQSEPEFLVSCLHRHPDWAVVICLVGGGQEINRGEAGISSWLDAIATTFPDWRVYVSSNLTDSEYDAEKAIEKLRQLGNLVEDNNLHLAVSMRSFRAEHVSGFVKAVLDCDAGTASAILAQFQTKYPIALTRSLGAARQWIRERARGTERVGLMASSGAQRLKPHAIDIRVNVDPVHWFLGRATDPRSSDFLEDAATEFQVQGLEVDWSCVTWDADLRFVDNDWSHHSFVGSKWQVVRNEDRRRYLRNAYRVLLTRARQGMVVVVPEGTSKDTTRPPEYYDHTFQYLRSTGIQVI